MKNEITVFTAVKHRIKVRGQSHDSIAPWALYLIDYYFRRSLIFQFDCCHDTSSKELDITWLALGGEGGVFYRPYFSSKNELFAYAL